MATNPNVMVIAVVSIIIQNDSYPGKVLMVVEGVNDPSIGKKEGMLCFPGGHLEVGDDPLVRVRQELFEETGYAKCEINGIFGIYFVKKLLALIYRAKVNKEPFNPQIDKEIRDNLWLTPEEIISGKYELRPGVKKVVEDFIKSQNKNLLSVDIVRSI